MSLIVGPKGIPQCGNSVIPDLDGCKKPVSRHLVLTGDSLIPAPNKVSVQHLEDLPQVFPSEDGTGRNDQVYRDFPAGDRCHGPFTVRKYACHDPLVPVTPGDFVAETERKACRIREPHHQVRSPAPVQRSIDTDV